MKKAEKIRGAFHALKAKFKSESINLPARSSFFFTLTNLLCKGMAFLFTPIFTRLLTPADYGEYSLFSTFLSLCAVAVTMEISGGIIMRLFQKERERRALSILSAWLISLVTALPTVLFLWLIRRFGGFGMSFPLAYPLLFTALTSISLINLYVSRCKFLYRWIPPLITSLLQSAVAPIISIALLRVNYFSSVDHVSLKIGAVTAVLGLTALTLSTIALKQAIREARTQKMSLRQVKSFTFSSARFLLKLAIPLLPYYLSIMIISQADKLFISSFIGNGELAKYSVAYSAGVALTAITGGVMGALLPWIMRRARANDYEKIRSTLDRMIWASVPTILIFLCFAPEFFAFLAPREYQTALPVLFISALIPIPLALAQCSSGIAIARERVGGVLLSGIIPATLCLALYKLLIPLASLNSIAVVTALGFIILCALGLTNVRKITGFYTVSVSKAFQSLMLLAFSATAIYSFRNTLALRIIIALFCGAILFSMAQPILSLLREKDA